MRIALIADEHSNYAALQATLNELASIGYDRCISAGDIVGYGYDPIGCIEIMEQHEVLRVRGNHDQYMLDALDGRDPPADINPLAIEAIRNNSRQLLKRGKGRWSDVFRGLPDHMDFDACGRRVFVVHGSPPNHVDRYAYPPNLPSLLELFKEDMLRMAGWPDVLVTAHTHKPYIHGFKGRLIINPGSVGQPRNGSPMASCAIVETEGRGGPQAELLAFEYDIDAAVRGLKEAGIDSNAAKRLIAGR
jgi:putative phosphoesterase